MGESEWVRLTEEGVDGSSSHYSYRKGSVLWKHGLAWTSTRKQCGPLRRPDQFLTDAELDALAAHAPAVKALVEALRAVEWGGAPGGGSMCPWCGGRRYDGHAPDCQRQAALAALDPATPEVDDG